MATSRTQLMKKLKVKYPKLFLKTTEEFGLNGGGIWSSGENGDEASDGFELFDYYAESNRYEFGVHTEMVEFLKINGWFAEWYDGGTIMFWEE